MLTAWLRRMYGWCRRNNKVGSWQLAVGSWQLAVGSWQLAVGKNLIDPVPVASMIYCNQ